ncbi:RsbRD N-terminal domain-containing protein [Bacteroidota bacterium]
MLKDILLNKKETIIGKWQQLIFDTYTSEATIFLKKEKNQFNNPVGVTITNNTEKLFIEIVNSESLEKIKLLLTDIIKIRAVQDFGPSQSVSFIFFLKKIIQEELSDEITTEEAFDELLNFLFKIDQVGLLAFDLYQESKETIFKIRLNEIKSKSHCVKG